MVVVYLVFVKFSHESYLVCFRQDKMMPSLHTHTHTHTHIYIYIYIQTHTHKVLYFVMEHNIIITEICIRKNL